MSAPRRLSAKRSRANHDAMVAFARAVYRTALDYADQLDPKNRHTSDAGNAFDRMADAAKWAHWYLTGTHVFAPTHSQDMSKTEGAR